MKTNMISILATALFAAVVDPSAPATGGAGAGAPAPDPVPAPAPKPAREKQNGVTRPSVGTATGNVWQIADSISAANNRPALRAEVTAAGAAAGINPATVTTQFGQWRRFYGIKKEVTVAVAGVVPTADAATAKPAKGKKGKAAAAPSTVPDGGAAVVTNEAGEVEPA